MKNYIVTKKKTHVCVHSTFTGVPKYIKNNKLYQKDAYDTYLGDIIAEYDSYPNLNEILQIARGM